MTHDTQLFEKTPHGKEEIAHGQTLARRARGALILVDGKTPWSALREKFAAFGDADALLAQLLAEAYLAPVAPPTVSATPAAPQPAKTSEKLPGYRSGQFRM